MGCLERISTSGVIGDSERRGLPAIYRVTRCAFSAIRAMGELAVVRIWLVTVHASRKGNRLLEVSASVALNTVHVRVFPQQWELGFRMIKFLVYRLD